MCTHLAWLPLRNPEELVSCSLLPRHRARISPVPFAAAGVSIFPGASLMLTSAGIMLSHCALMVGSPALAVMTLDNETCLQECLRVQMSLPEQDFQSQ
jgi:hypothetical protein